MIQKRGLSLTKAQKQCLYSLHEWRNNQAREEDESPEYILKIKDMIKLSQILPRNPTDIMSNFNPLPSNISLYMNDICNVIKESVNNKSIDLIENNNNNKLHTVLSFHSPPLQTTDSINNIAELMESVDWTPHEIISNNNVKINKNNINSNSILIPSEESLFTPFNTIDCSNKNPLFEAISKSFNMNDLLSGSLTLISAESLNDESEKISEGIPSELNEIYEKCNEIRKTNKDKKKREASAVSVYYIYIIIIIILFYRKKMKLQERKSKLHNH